ncbi:YbbR-like domain-containing protein [Croceitalea sp. P059]|uniref:CdaR family protein n=1 Tax=Croceitalea sp. P059 TaxID=3075601 RepID=UPI002888B4D1|nr:YbbR-like domain-containing protein [Croceitalea sp. P059]MDT0539973.1 YbbR-like domain-containing protein [Croceitalea sp. P059]
MLKKLVTNLNQRKVKVFLLFLICSFLAWSLSKLSESYESRAAFEIDYINFPDTLLLNTAEKQFVNTKLRTSGFQFLSYGISPKKLKIDLNNVSFSNGRYYMSANTIKPQFEKQLSNTISIIEFEEQQVFIDLYQVIKKEVPIEPDVSIELAQNHLLEGDLKIEPNIIVLKGPSNEVKSITKIKTEQLIFNELKEDFSKSVGIVIPDGLVNGEISTNSVKVSGKVVRFSEKEYTISIEAKNVPVGFRIRMFPNQVGLVCKASIDTLKDISNDDFEVVVDCSNIDKTKSQLLIEVSKSPENIYAVQLLNNQIEFVLEKL